MRNILITSAAAALLTVGAASAADVQVIETPGTDVTVYVTTFDPQAWADDAGVLTADVVGAPNSMTDAALLFDGAITDPDVMIYVYDDETGTRVVNAPLALD